MKLTTNTDETMFGLLLSGDRIFSIPYFQRPYKWRDDKLEKLEKDIESIIETDDSHFLGAIIIFERQSSPTEPNHYEIIDGQQRTTTIFLYLCAIIKQLCKVEKYYEASSLFKRYIVIDRDSQLSSNLKLQSCRDDRSDLNKVIEDLLNNNVFKQKLGTFEYHKLKANDSQSARIWKNYQHACKYLKRQVDEYGPDRLIEIFKVVLESMSVVQIVVKNPTDGPKIYNSLNSSQEPMTTGDLIRNEIFAKIANEPTDVIDRIELQHWQPFYQRFDNNDRATFDNYFFPFGLIYDHNVKKSGVYELLRRRWKSTDDAKFIISELSEYQSAFIDIVKGTRTSQLSNAVHQIMLNLKMTNLPSSTFPFLMQLIRSTERHLITESTCCDVLRVVENFLVRRAICGYEPTGLHAVFKRLWSDSGEGAINVKSTVDAIKNHKTVTWPTNDEVRTKVLERPIYGSTICSYILTEWNKSIGGDNPSQENQIEHVLPVTMSQHWKDNFTSEQHKRYVHVLANLVMLTQSMNGSVGNESYVVKRERYSNDSCFKSTRKFAEEFSSWNPCDIEVRGNYLADWVVRRWPDSAQ
jgi:uncharacterized protein with ParB-like and HNH nuclease domain